MSVPVSARVSMYRLNELGDCFLGRFDTGSQKSRMLIDCGSFRNSSASVKQLDKVTGAIVKELAGAPLDVVVGTHQHNDHVSGFVHCEKTFRKMNIGQVWLSWLDNPADRKARAIGDAHTSLLMALQAARANLRAALSAPDGARPLASRSLEVLQDVLGFYGVTDGSPPEIPAQAVKILKTLGKQKPDYLIPGRSVDMPGLPPGSVRVHVLGPPRSDSDLYRKDPKAGESYDKALAEALQLASRFLDASTQRNLSASPDEAGYPFNQQYKRRESGQRHSPALNALIKRYRSPQSTWRTVDDDWMQQAEALALYLDTFTNNSSLVLAIELVASGKVLLFAADAQTGNWASWERIKWADAHVSTDDLLARTVFYKVGHHASHNATLVSAFEKMGTPELVALIPVHKADPNITKTNGWKMPAKNLFKRIKEKTNGRVLQMDCANPPDCDPTKDPARTAWKKAGITPRLGDLAIELDFT
jgi:glyoxylase-like metal-dependent hydrolase (beta-lactamase superfamily II)